MNVEPATIPTVRRLHEAAAAAAVMGSPFYAALITEATRDFQRGGIVARLLAGERARSSRLGVRLMAPLHNLALSGAEPALAAAFPSCGGDGDAERAWSAAARAIEAHFERVGRLFDAVPQTNEPARSMPLLAALLHVVAHCAKPVRLYEIGASAALNSRLDAFSYEGDGWRWGDPSSPLLLRNRTRANAPRNLDAFLAIEERRACDLHPLDLERPKDVRFLQSYVWADQLERFDRLRDAIAAARRIPMAIDRADAREWLASEVALRDGYLTVVMQSALFEHLPQDVRTTIVDRIQRLGFAATHAGPFAWVRMEAAASAYETRATIWPDGDDALLATSDGHAQGIAWE